MPMLLKKMWTKYLIYSSKKSQLKICQLAFIINPRIEDTVIIVNIYMCKSSEVNYADVSTENVNQIFNLPVEFIINLFGKQYVCK